MRKYYFVIREYDSQASFTKFRKMHMYGTDVHHAYEKAVAYMNRNYNKLDYDYKLLTLNEYNRLKTNRYWILSILSNHWLALYGIIFITIIITIIIISNLQG